MPTVLRNLRIKRVASVDQGAGVGVEILLMKRNDALPPPADAYLKRAFPEERRRALAASGAALPDGSYPIENKEDLHNAMQAIGRARDPAKVKAHIRSRAAALGLTDELSDTFKRAHVFEEAVAALKKSIAAIIGEPDEPKREDACASIEQFSDYLKAQAAGIAATAGRASLQDEDDMSDAVKKALGLDVSASEDHVLRAVTLLKMSQKHKDYMDEADMSDEERAKFFAMSPAEREAHCADNPIEKRLPEEIRKALAKAAENEKILKALQEKDEIATFAKRALAIGLPEAEGETLRKAHRGEAAALAKIETMLKGLAEQVRTGKLFAEFGKAGSAGLGDAEAQIKAKADEYRKGQEAIGKSCSDAQAFSKIYTDPANVELKQRYDAEQAQRKRQP